MGKNRRGVIEIKMDLLENAVRHAEGITRMMHSCNLSYLTLKRYVQELTASNLLSEVLVRQKYRVARGYAVTEKGLRALHLYRESSQLLN